MHGLVFRASLFRLVFDVLDMDNPIINLYFLLSCRNFPSSVCMGACRSSVGIRWKGVRMGPLRCVAVLERVFFCVLLPEERGERSKNAEETERSQNTSRTQQNAMRR